MKTATIQLEVSYDENVTDPDAVAVCLDNVVRMGAEMLPLDEYGNPEFGDTIVVGE